MKDVVGNSDDSVVGSAVVDALAEDQMQILISQKRGSSTANDQRRRRQCCGGIGGQRRVYTSRCTSAVKFSLLVLIEEAAVEGECHGFIC